MKQNQEKVKQVEKINQRIEKWILCSITSKRQGYRFVFRIIIIDDDDDDNRMNKQTERTG